MIKVFGKFVMSSLVDAAFIFSLSFSAPANAQVRGGQRLQKAQNKEQSQIRQGVKSGKLTKAQAKNLEKHEKQIQSKVAEDKADGKLTPQEARSLKNATQKEERAINGAEDANKDKSGTTPPNQQ